MTKENELMKQLYDQALSFKAGEVHAELGEIFGDNKATGVISVYIDQKPANKILDELWEWAERRNDIDLTNKIEELAQS